MALFDLDHLTGTNLNSQDSELKTEDLFDLTVTTQVRRNKAVSIGMLTQCRIHSRLLGANNEWNNAAVPTILYMHSQLLGPNVEWNHRPIHTILDTTQGK